MVRSPLQRLAFIEQGPMVQLFVKIKFERRALESCRMSGKGPDVSAWARVLATGPFMPPRGKMGHGAIAKLWFHVGLEWFVAVLLAVNSGVHGFFRPYREEATMPVG